jgi:tRNA-specific 2-thiouridylase
MNQTVYVGMSGGVDSSVTAALLKEQGYKVVGVYMKNWTQDLPGMPCPWKEDYQDAKRVAVHLGIDFKVYDFQTQYRQKVVDYMIAEYRAGRTPNPDIMCNQEVKFKLFLETALEDGADLIATGHYARVINDSGSTKSQATNPKQIQNSKSKTQNTAQTSSGRHSREGGNPVNRSSLHTSLLIPHCSLYTGVDKNKDQSYFLHRVTEEALAKTLMPIGEYHKSEVRELAKKFGLITADKKDSQGICFVGKVGIKDFLLAELGKQPHGAIIDQHGREIGDHDGALFYTIGQRHGLQVGGGLPFYVVGKDMEKNEIYVTTDLQDDRLWHRELRLTSPHWINGQQDKARQYKVRTRYRAPLVGCTITEKNGIIILALDGDVRAITPGQSAVIYDGDHCLGGGIVI